MSFFEPKKDSAGMNLDMEQLKGTVHRRLLETLDLHEARKMPREQLQTICLQRIDALLNEQRHPLTSPEKQKLLHEVMDEVFGLGPLEVLLRDYTISDILVNGPHQIYIERYGKLELTDVAFRDNQHLIQVIQRIGSTVGRRIDDSCPMLDARLVDGSRVHAIIPPLAIDGPALSIRRFGTIPINIKKLLELNTLTEDMALFLQVCVRCKMNILVSGGTGTGKTTLLNVLSRWVPGSERIITIEDAAELQMQQDHVVRLETRPPNIEDKGEVNQRELLRNSLRMRPDRIIIGEVRGPETLDMLQAMNTGHEGSMTTVHANSPRDALRRLENMVAMAGIGIPTRAIREQMCSALNILVHLQRVTGGRRKIVSVAEITGMEGETICLQNIFIYRQAGIDAQGNARGHFEACGVRPVVLNKLQAENVELPADIFQNRVLPDYKVEVKDEKSAQPA